MNGHGSAVAIGLILAATTALGFFLPGWLLNQLLLAFSRGLVVLGLVVLWRGGLVSLGGALYFGLGAYAVAILKREAGVADAVLLLLAATVVATVSGWLLGFVLKRYRGIFFAMMNLAFSMILYGAIVKSRTLGSTDGFSVGLPSYLGVAFADAASAKLALFVLLMMASAGAIYAVRAYWGSTLGWLGTGIRDNEIRVEYLGYSVERVIHVKYVVSAALAGLGGGFTALALGQVDPDSMVNWLISGELVFVMILSGAGSALAPFLGSLIFELMRTYAYELAPRAWQFAIGLTLLLVILFLPGGLWSIFERGRRARL